jgi:hypothetical protein
MPRYYRTFLATGLLTALTLPALAQTPASQPAPAATAAAPTPTTVSPAKAEATPGKPLPKHHVSHRHHVETAKKNSAKTPAAKH